MRNFTNKQVSNDKAPVAESTNKSTVNSADYMYYSKVLKEAFNTVTDLKKAEEAYYAKLKVKEDKAAQKKADAMKVEEAFKALNAARKDYKEDLATLATEYHEALKKLKDTFEFGKKDVHAKLAAAEESFNAELKKFADTYGQYHFSLKGDDFETTVSGNIKTATAGEASKTSDIFDIFDLMFNF